MTTQTRNYSIQVLNKYDPTHTTTLRNDFSRAMRKRFVLIRGLIRKAIIDRDCFGLQKADIHAFQDVNLPSHGQFAFTRSGDKVEAFMEWLREQSEKGILETHKIQQAGAAIERAWTDTYINSAYRKGVENARQQLLKYGYDVPDLEATGGIEASMAAPFHADRVGLLYTRTFNDLKNITDVMDGQISRVLSQAMAEGRNPREMAKLLTRTISGPVGDLGLTDTLGRFMPAQRRAEILARTEAIRAHHVSMVQEYKNWELEGVVIQAEWRTAGDGRVCEQCASLEGRVYSLREVEGLIPYHPQCRCIALPLDKTPKKKEQVEQPIFPVGKKPVGKTAKISKKEIRKLREQEYKTRSKEFHDVMESNPFLKEYLDDYYAGKIERSYFLQQLERLSDGFKDKWPDLPVKFKRMKAAEYEWAKVLSPTEMKKWKRNLITKRYKHKFIFEGKNAKEMKPMYIEEIERGFKIFPYDVLDDMLDEGLVYKINASLDRAFYHNKFKSVNLNFNTHTFDIVAHETAHALDSLLSVGADGRVAFGWNPKKSFVGMVWQNNRYLKNGKKISDGLVQKYWKQARRLVDKEHPVLRNKDGVHFKGAFIDPYEGRIYEMTYGGRGVEWWTMNVQRYSKYKVWHTRELENIKKNLVYMQEHKERVLNRLERLKGRIGKLDPEDRTFKNSLYKSTIEEIKVIENTTIPRADRSIIEYKTQLNNPVEVRNEYQRLSKWVDGKRLAPELGEFIEKIFSKNVLGDWDDWAL